ncbi:pantoate--beta-alanine ligase [Marinigracilibium pacificum]|uniref:Pantothenate synthetase n=1 Tax=Marinigracilibium pacificum TaxID=2729599 RepID=A0A848IUY9_9BACT|nr:pantoate--beta-alanine ligase [Marinigracilibium pacificum]NMM47041.1 pantoate--beta-alanine ligase [Marinigracilibium pacificum]
MEVFSSVHSYYKWWRAQPKNLKIGFVPTMGALHEGHMALIAESVKNADLTVASIFVNPTQFNDPEDLQKYPRTPEQDINLLKAAGCDAVLMPEAKDIYSDNYDISINPGESANILEGAFRPGHFQGVLQVVSKLFNIVKPDLAFFGRKDLQQLQLIKKMVSAMSFNIEVIGVGTKREESGLAMSSRNMRLSDKERSDALLLYENLILADKLWQDGKEISEIKNAVTENFNNFEPVKLEYFEAVEPDAFEIVNSREGVKQKIAFCVAAYVGQVRLIDNILIDN